MRGVHRQVLLIRAIASRRSDAVDRSVTMRMFLVFWLRVLKLLFAPVDAI